MTAGRCARGRDGRDRRARSPTTPSLVADTGYAAAWAGALAEIEAAGRHFLRADGSLGWAFPASLGAQLAVPDKQVICIIGDGGFGYHIGDLETALRLHLPVIVVILNNQTLAFEAHVQTLLYGHLVPEVDDFLDVDYGQVARASGRRASASRMPPSSARLLHWVSNDAVRRSSMRSSTATRSHP